MNDSPLQSELDRREFLRMTLMSSAMLMASPSPLMGMETSSPGHPPAYAALESLPPGAVRPEGWLRTYLERQAAELGSKLPQVSWPFTGAYWAGEEDSGQTEKEWTWWAWEQKGYWIDGATRLALVLGDEQLLRQAQAPLEYTLSHAGMDEFLGPNSFKNLTDGYARWPQTIFFRGLSAASDANSIPRIPEAMQKHYLSDKANYGMAPRNITNVEELLWCYERTGDARLLALAEKAWKDFTTNAGGLERFPTHGDHCDLSPLKVFAAAPIDSHGVDYIEVAKQPAILYLYTGKPEYLKFALAAQRRIFDFHMLIDGTPSTSEWYRYRTSLDSHETCDITDHTWTWGYMLMATGNGVWGDRVERALFNAGFGAIKKDWKALQYFSFPNQVAETGFQPNPGQRVACCGGNIHRLFPNYVIRMWMKDQHGGLAATLYGPSKLKTTVGPEHQAVEIVQATDYPFGEQIHFTIHAKQAVSFPLSLRIPAWCDAPRILINSSPAPLPPIKDGFATLARKFSPGDTVTLILPMKAAVSNWPQNGIGIEHGPLVYSLSPGETWTSKVEPKYTTAEYPAWTATAAGAWNYGLAVDPEKLASQVKVQRKPMTKDPWVDPPVTLTVPARKIEDWELQSNPENASQKFTPPLPEPGASKVSETVEQVALVPYGSTHLRITIFPRLPAS